MNSNEALDFVRNVQFSQRIKHIDIHYYFIQDYLEKGDILLQYLPIDAIIANILTKPLDKVKFERFRSQLGVVDLETDLEGS